MIHRRERTPLLSSPVQRLPRAEGTALQSPYVCGVCLHGCRPNRGEICVLCSCVNKLCARSCVV